MTPNQLTSLSAGKAVAAATAAAAAAASAPVFTAPRPRSRRRGAKHVFQQLATRGGSLRIPGWS